MPVPARDRTILRELGQQIAEIAALDVQRERRELWRKIENLERAKPAVTIYQIPWHEMDVQGELQLRCEDRFCQRIEQDMRRTLYCWRHMQVDMTVSGVRGQPLAIRDTGFGISEKADIVRTDPASDVVSRHFQIQIREEADAEKIRFPEVSHDSVATEEAYQKQLEIFDGVLPVKKVKQGGFWFAPWDELVRWTGVQEILMDMVLRPAYVHRLISRYVDAWLHRLAQYEAQDLLAAPCHELWGVGAAQIFSEVSPEMHEEFALKHEARWFSRFGKNYYGCCEPLHHKVDVIRRNIPRLRKISMSPWVKFDQAVANVGRDMIFAWKPNPAHLAGESWQPEFVRQHLRERLHQARNCVVEIHLKDISTVRYQPQRLWEWARIAAEVTQEFA
jgi:hypothetical protein